MKRGLFLKYVVLFVGLVTGVLVINAALDLWFVYRDNRRASIEVQKEKADAAAQKIESFVRNIENQIGWVAQAQWAALPVEQRRFDDVRLLRQVPAITELVQLDRQGREQLRVSRLSMDVVGAGTDRSTEPAFVEAMANRVYFGPVYFRKESEPYLTMAVAHGGKSGVTIAEVNLKLIWDVVSQIKVGKEGYAYVVDRLGRLVAHPDISLVLRGTDMSRLAQVASALKQGQDTGPVDARNRAGVSVLSAHADIPALGWLVFVEVPTAEAQQPVINAGLRALALMVLGLLIAGGAGALLARRMVVPIRTMQAGAERIGSGELDHRLAIRTGDELEALADQFNRSAEALQQSYETLEQRVEDRTRELSESLEQQTATAEILRVISQSPTDVQPVLHVVATAALRFCGATDAMIALREGDDLVNVAHEGPLAAQIGRRRPIDRTSVSGRAAAEKRTIHVPDSALLDPEDYAGAIELARTRGWRAALAAPLLREGDAAGMIMLRKSEPGAFTPRQIELLETFAAQAVIAIENVRLFTELRESLEQQTATAEILRVISQSPTDVAPVLSAVVKAAVRFCGAQHAHIALRDGDSFYPAAHEGILGDVGERRPLERSSGLARAILEGRTVHTPDIDATDPVEFATSRMLARQHGWRAAIAAPMLREGVAIGAIGLRKSDPGPFTSRQIELLEAFAAQAVIALENVRLFTELRESLEQQTATADVLKAIAQSAFDGRAVFTALLDASARLCEAESALLFLVRDGALRLFSVSQRGGGPENIDAVQDTPITRGSIGGRAVIEGKPVNVADVLADPEYTNHAFQKARGFRAVLSVPLLRDGEPIGTINVSRDAPGAFSRRHVELLGTFADQAVIAMANLRMIDEIRDKSRELEVASQHKSQFLANMSHELRTPLNAIIGYTEMMADGLYGNMPEKAQGVLERVQSNGKHLLGLINDVLDLSKIEAGQLVLAAEEYSVGDMVATVISATESLARAKGLALTSKLAPGLPVGIGDARRLTQVLLNLVGNAIKFTDQGGVEIRASHRADRFDISVVDSGPGIAPADQGKIFEEFQQIDNTSTRRKGGTGLGLSISRRIVELHGGRITVESEVGTGSTFTISIPVNAQPVKDAAQ